MFETFLTHRRRTEQAEYKDASPYLQIERKIICIRHNSNNWYFAASRCTRSTRVRMDDIFAVKKAAGFTYSIFSALIDNKSYWITEELETNFNATGHCARLEIELSAWQTVNILKRVSFLFTKGEYTVGPPAFSTTFGFSGNTQCWQC